MIEVRRGYDLSTVAKVMQLKDSPPTRVGCISGIWLATFRRLSVSGSQFGRSRRWTIRAKGRVADRPTAKGQSAETKF